MAQARAFRVYQNFLRTMSKGEKARLIEKLSHIKPVRPSKGDASFVKSFERVALDVSRQKNIQLPVQYLSMFYFSNKLNAKPTEADFSDFPEVKEDQNDESVCCRIL